MKISAMMKKKIIRDFSHLFVPDSTKIKIAEYYASVCSRCGGMCCSYNTSPIHAEFSLPTNMMDENIVILKKGLILHKDFRRRFFRNIRKSFFHLETKGFGKGLLQYIDKNKFSLKAIVKAYMRVDREINDYNRRMYEKDPLDMAGRVISDCFLLIPGKGCVLEEYRPFTCKTAFRKCFAELNLFEYVEANTFRVNEKDLFDYIRADLIIDEDSTLPKIIIGASDLMKENISKLKPDETPAFFRRLSYFQLANLADYVAIPYLKMKACLKDIIKPSISAFFPYEGVKVAPHLVFIDEIYPGDPDNSFDFGLDYAQLFRVGER